MKRRTQTLALVALAVFRAGVALAQHEGHQMPGQASPAAVDPHAQASLIEVERMSTVLEEARQSNDPARLRAAMDELQNALGAIKMNLAMIAGTVAPGAGMPPGMSGMDRSGMAQPQPQAAPDSRAGGPPKTSGTQPAAPMDRGMDHLKMKPGQHLVKDPVCGMSVEPKPELKAIYEGKTFFFCSEADRDKFLKDPRKYVKQ